MLPICPICHADLSENIILVTHESDHDINAAQKRGHYFHRECIENWRDYQINDDLSDLLPDWAQNLNITYYCPMDRDPVKSLHETSVHHIHPFDLCDYNGDFKVVLNTLPVDKEIIDQMDDIDEVDCNNRTLAYYACSRGHVKLVLILMRKGANFLYRCDWTGFTPLMAAINSGHVTLVRMLLRNPKIREKIITQADDNGLVSFYHACAGAHYQIVHAFLKEDLYTTHQLSYAYRVYGYTLINHKTYGRSFLSLFHSYLVNQNQRKKSTMFQK
jgi:hypothetical protein